MGIGKTKQTMKLLNLFLFSLNSVSAAPPTNGEMLAGFGTEKKDELNKWFIENDGVMGGLSKGHYTIDNENEMMTFNGTISLEQNGGFSLVSGTKNYGEKNESWRFQRYSWACEVRWSKVSTGTANQ